MARGWLAVLCLVAAACSDDAEPVAEADPVCVESGGMDGLAVGIPAGRPEAVATAFMKEVLGWADGTVAPGDSACSFTVQREADGPTVDVRTAGSGAEAQLAWASSHDGPDDQAPLSVSFLGADAQVHSSATCPTCASATVHFLHGGGVQTVDTELPIDARAIVPADATDRGLIILLRDADGGVEGVMATAISDGDFAAG